MATIATVTGTMLVPGVSRNGRWYKSEAIGRAVDRARLRLAEGGAPVTMRVAHPADEARAPVTEIVGRVTQVWQEADGRARFRADVADTTHGRDLLTLVDTRGGQPFLRGVSIRGAWLGPVRKEQSPDGQVVETADDLELDGLDWTHKPGVPGAQVESVDGPSSEPRESDGSGRTLILESVQEATLTAITEADAPDSGGPFADPGYRPDGKKRLPLDSRRAAKAAWRHLAEADNTRAYTAAQLKRIRQRTVKALKSFGVQVAAQEGWLIDRLGQVNESLAEAMGMGDQYTRPGSFSVNLDNGVVCVTVASYCLDPHDLDKIGRAAMEGACAALAAIDPDMDGDIDVPGAPMQDTDSDTADEAGPADSSPVNEAAPEASTTEPPATPNEAPEQGADPNQEMEEPAVSEPTNPAVEPATAAAAPAPVAGITFTDDQFAQLLSRLAPAANLAVAAAESAPTVPAVKAEEAAPAAEPAAQVTESEEQRITRLVNEALAAERTKLVQDIVEQSGPPQRKGIVSGVAEAANTATGGAYDLPESWPQKPLHQYTEAERRQYIEGAMVGAVLKGRGERGE